MYEGVKVICEGMVIESRITVLTASAPDIYGSECIMV